MSKDKPPLIFIALVQPHDRSKPLIHFPSTGQILISYLSEPFQPHEFTRNLPMSWFIASLTIDTLYDLSITIALLT